MSLRRRAKSHKVKNDLLHFHSPASCEKSDGRSDLKGAALGALTQKLSSGQLTAALHPLGAAVTGDTPAQVQGAQALPAFRRKRNPLAPNYSAGNETALHCRSVRDMSAALCRRLTAASLWLGARYAQNKTA